MESRSITEARQRQAHDATGPTEPWPERKTGRIRISEPEAGEVYPILLEAEKEALMNLVHAREAGDPTADTLRRRLRRLERHRRKYLALFEEMAWTIPLE